MKIKDITFKIGKFFCKWLHWHKSDGLIWAKDPVNVHSTCKYCGKEIMQDSQGNWF
jgi:hypothetical protein